MDSQLKDYKATLNLPQTDFPMRGSLSQREPEQISRWQNDRIYDQLIQKNRAENAPRFLLHDGPPYANGNIHLGHSLNKVLKDIIVKYKNMSGYRAEYIPGWDCHGLPIELGVEKLLLEQKRDKNQVPILELREMCRSYAQKYIDIQKEQFQRLEVFADWDHPYMTMAPQYVAGIIRELGRCSQAGMLYRGNKPVYWCPHCATALAEAEIEYKDKKSPSIYVKFDLTSDAVASFPELKEAARREGADRISLIIWTTTPWTLPANLGIALHPEFEYVAIKVPGLEGTELWIVAKELQGSVEKLAGFEKPSTPVLNFKAEKLHKKKAKHPFIDRESMILLGEHVTQDAGTGLVHTAPGHGADDYLMGLKYGLDIFAPVDQYGKFNQNFPEMKGQFIFKANKAIIAMLQESGHLISEQEIEHSYPHCWRCHQAVIFRATPQWFIGMERRPGQPRSLREEALVEIQKCTWIPSWGFNRITAMIESRPDWCISRQRVWGVPITVFYCEDCSEPKADEATFKHVADIVQSQGVDRWFTDPVEKFLPPHSQCERCGSKKFTKEKDILDVWFDSGVSHAAVLEARNLGWPGDLCLEGSDQHRGWFQTSLLTAVATRKHAPYRTILTHGFVNDKEGKKMSKSKGNIISPLDIMKTHGSENLRLWVLLEDYRNDLSFSSESLDRVSEAYKKIRNTIRFLLGNLFDFNPEQHAVSLSEMGDLDRWALSRTFDVLEKIQNAYDSYEFYKLYHLVMNFFGVELSSVYFDILKDRLYTAAVNSKERRSSQTALMEIGKAVIQSLAPVLSFTAEEAWGYLPAFKNKTSSVFLSGFPNLKTGSLRNWRDRALEEEFSVVWTLREAVLKALEEARRDKQIGHAREAKAVLTALPSQSEILRSIKEDMSRLFLVSDLEVIEGDSIHARIEKAQGAKCARCWVHVPTVGRSGKFPDLCHRCIEAVTLNES